MKKTLMALMAVAAIVLGMSSCKPNSKTATVKFVNEYNDAAMILLSPDEYCSSLDEADYYAVMDAHKSYSVKNVKLNDLYAIFFVKDVEASTEEVTSFKRVSTSNLNEFVGFRTVTLTVTENGYSSVDGSTAFDF